MSDAEQSEPPVRVETPENESETADLPVTPLVLRTLSQTPRRIESSEDNTDTLDFQDSLVNHPLPSPVPEPQGRWDDSDHVSDRDSAIGAESNRTSTVSLTPSVVDFRVINGRAYHGQRFDDSPYWGANDDDQQYAQNKQYYVFQLHLEGKLCHANLPKNLDKVLDLGCGLGTWAIDFADEHPEAEVIGTDISPIQSENVPLNLKFQIHDFNTDFTWDDNSFDFVHLRWLIGSVTDWSHLFRQTFRILKPGALIETFDCEPNMCSDDNTVKDDSCLGQWGSIFATAFKNTEFSIISKNIQRKGLEDAGFEIITERDHKVTAISAICRAEARNHSLMDLQPIKIPVGEWPRDKKKKKIGRISQQAITGDIIGTIGRATDKMGWSQARTQVFAAHIRRELSNKDVHAWYLSRAIVARKPVVV